MPAAVLTLLGALTAIGPFALDLYLAAFPQIAQELGTTPTEVQLTLTACMIGLAVGQLVTGIASDAIGRKRPLVVGMALFLAFSVLCMLAPGIWWLILGRFLQGVGGGAGIVVARAVIRDRTSGEAMIRALTTVMVLLGLAPILAPMLGGVLMRLTDWRGVFASLAVIALLLLLGSLTLPESLPLERRHPPRLKKVRADFAAVLTDRAWQYGAGSVSLTSAAVFVYIGSSSFVFQEVYGLSPLQFSVLFGINAANFMIFSQSNRLLSRWFTPQQRLGMATLGLSIAGVVLLTAASLDRAPIWLAIVGFALLPASHGVGSPNGIAIALENHGDRAGSASALHGVLQYVVAAVTIPLVGEKIQGIAVGVCSMAAALVLLRLAVKRAREPREAAVRTATAEPSTVD
ncbi:multidrug effflux MFS transporter [Cumulibacter manganitolerans]|uniref:multidrug effflux MFS transporter n=1 Tax=Cumulibacter manganitolerans TaxID=1884992 RepID=UPI001294C4F2|nr:multidrug effflux MFS transporter [Cumulibacter manganitolerans]